MRGAYVCVKLTDEAGEVVVLEINREDEAREIQGIKNDEAIVGCAPSYERIGIGIADHMESLHYKRWNHIVLLHPIKVYVCVRVSNCFECGWCCFAVLLC